MTDYRNFKSDLNDSLEMPKSEWERLYRQIFKTELKKVNWNIEKNLEVQKGMGVDCVIETNRGRRYSIENKCRQNKYISGNDCLLEIVHHIYTDEKRTEKKGTKNGWLYTTTAEIICYAWASIDKTSIVKGVAFSLNPFKERSFSKELEEFDICWGRTKFEDGSIQLSLNKILPIEFIRKNAKYFWSQDFEEVTTCQSTL